jgi:hypothetical protein
MRSKKAITITMLALVALSACQIATAAGGATGTGSAWGAQAAASDQALSIESMLRYAIQDEYLARAEYEAIMKRYGVIRPFSNIIQSEESHIAWLKAEYTARALAIPADEAAALTVVPATLVEAFQTGVQAEIDNIAMYERFLASPLLAQAENAGLKALFIRLRDASKNHLAAFRNQLSRR